MGKGAKPWCEKHRCIKNKWVKREERFVCPQCLKEYNKQDQNARPIRVNTTSNIDQNARPIRVNTNSNIDQNARPIRVNTNSNIDQNTRPIRVNTNSNIVRKDYRRPAQTKSYHLEW